MSNEQTKTTILDALVAHLSEGLDQASAAVGLERIEAEPIAQDEHRVDDVSQQDEAGDMHAMFQEVDTKQRALVDAAAALPRTASNVVEPGAVITMDGENYIIGVASDEFTVDGASYSGISTQAPIYEAIAGKRAGESAEFNGRKLTITGVL